MSSTRSGGRFTDPVVDYLLQAAKPVGRNGGVLLGLLIIGTVALLDYWLGPIVELTGLYMFGPIVTGWCAGRRDGLVLAAVSAFSSTLMHLTSGTLTASAVPLLATLLLRFAATGTLVVLVAQVRNTTELYEELSMRDDLTSLLNRRALVQQLESEISRARRYSTPFALIYADVDLFKEVNDRYGHTVGDEYLMRIAEAMKLTLRPTDITARVGGDEFLVVLPETDEKGARALAERLAEQLDGLEEEYGTGLALGVVGFSTAPESVGAAITAADNEMYSVKRARKAALAESERTTGAAPAPAPPQSTT